MQSIYSANIFLLIKIRYCQKNTNLIYLTKDCKYSTVKHFYTYCYMRNHNKQLKKKNLWLNHGKYWFNAVDWWRKYARSTIHVCSLIAELLVLLIFLSKINTYIYSTQILCYVCTVQHQHTYCYVNAYEKKIKLQYRTNNTQTIWHCSANTI